MSNFKPKDLLEFIQIQWNRPIGLIASYIVTFGSISALSVFIELDKLSRYIILLSAISLITLSWLFSRKIPRVKKGKIGFVVNFSCSDENDQIKFKEDFVEHLQRLIKNSTAGKTFQFIDLSKKLHKKIVDDDDAHWLRRKTKTHFLLYGQLKKRMVKGEQTYVLSMDGQISHRPIPAELSQKIAREFAELLPRTTLIKSDDDVFNFEFTSSWTAYVAKYIIAIAAAISFDLQYAELLLSEIQKSMNNKKTDFPILLKLQDLVTQRLTEINIMQAKFNYDLWRRNRKKVYIETAGNYLEKIPESQRQNYEYINAKAIFLFLEKKDVQGAIQILKKCKRIDHPVWYMNLAFLHAYSGNLYDAIRQYRKALEYTMEPELISHIEEFLCWSIEEEPDKYQLFYLLGYFNWQIKEDLKQALEDLKNFQKQRQQNKFEKEHEICEKWIKQIKATK